VEKAIILNRESNKENGQIYMKIIMSNIKSSNHRDCEVLYIGEYNNGIRTGLWITKH
jgi:hypothetical protein